MFSEKSFSESTNPKKSDDNINDIFAGQTVNIDNWIENEQKKMKNLVNNLSEKEKLELNGRLEGGNREYREMASRALAFNLDGEGNIRNFNESLALAFPDQAGEFFPNDSADTNMTKLAEDYMPNLATLYSGTANDRGNFLKRIQIIKAMQNLVDLAVNDGCFGDTVKLEQFFDFQKELLNDKNNTALENLLIYDGLQEISAYGFLAGDTLEGKAGSIYDNPSLKSENDWQKLLDSHDEQIYDFQDDKYNCLEINFRPAAQEKLITGRYLDASSLPIRPFNKKDYYNDKSHRLDGLGLDNEQGGDKSEIFSEYITCDLAPTVLGVYNLDGSLIGWKEKDPEFEKALASGQKLNIDLDTSLATEGNKIEFKDQSELAAFKVLNSLRMRKLLNDEFAIDIASFPPRVQYQFSNFLSTKKASEFETLKSFLQTDDPVILKRHKIMAFLCLESDNQAVDTMKEVNQEFSPDNSAKFFKIISDLNLLATLESEKLQALFFNDKDYFKKKGSSADLFRQEILTGSLNFLKSAKQNIVKNTANEFLKELEEKKTECLLLSLILRSIKKDGHSFDFEDIKNLHLDLKDFGEDLAEGDKKEIIDIATENWRGFGNQKMAEVVIDGLQASLAEANNQRAYILRYKDKIVGFIRFEKKGEHDYYVGSLNVNKDLRGLNIGEQLMENTMILESENNVLEATASIKIPAGCSYIEKVGFVADGIIENYHGTGESLFSIKLDKENNKNFALRSEGKEQETSPAELIKAADDYHDLDKLLGQPFFVLRFDLLSEMDEYQKTLKRLLPRVDDQQDYLEEKKDKYTLTRYFYDKEEDKQGNIRYLAFEKN